MGTDYSKAASAMSQVLGVLQSELTQARAMVASSVFLVGSRESAESSLFVAKGWIDWLGGEGRQKVLSGEIDSSQWRDGAATAHNIIGEVTGYAGEWQASAFLGNVTLAIGQSIADTASNVGSGAVKSIQWLTVAIVAVAIIYLASIYKSA